MTDSEHPEGFVSANPDEDGEDLVHNLRPSIVLENVSEIHTDELPRFIKPGAPIDLSMRRSREFITKDSGERQEFETGMVRDTQTGKPRYDLIPSLALRRVADLYARGAEKYGDNNWHKGQPFSRTLASLERHLHQFKDGETDEDHLAAVVWNTLAIMHYQETGRDELDDLPRFGTSKK